MIVANLACTLSTLDRMLARNRQMGACKSKGKRSTACVYFYMASTRISARDNIGTPTRLCPQKTTLKASFWCSPCPSSPVLPPRIPPCFQSLPLGSSRPRCPVVHMDVQVVYLPAHLPFSPHSKCPLCTSLPHQGFLGKEKCSPTHLVANMIMCGAMRYALGRSVLPATVDLAKPFRIHQLNST